MAVHHVDMDVVGASGLDGRRSSPSRAKSAEIDGAMRTGQGHETPAARGDDNNDPLHPHGRGGQVRGSTHPCGVSGRIDSSRVMRWLAGGWARWPHSEARADVATDAIGTACDCQEARSMPSE